MLAASDPGRYFGPARKKGLVLAREEPLLTTVGSVTNLASPPAGCVRDRKIDVRPPSLDVRRDRVPDRSECVQYSAAHTHALVYRGGRCGHVSRRSADC